MGRSASPKRTSYIQNLPHDLMHIIFSRLKFRDKVNAGLVCKLWEELLTASSHAARHWVVDYDVDSVMSSTVLMTAGLDSSSQQPSFVIVRWFAKRVGAIKSVRVSATLSSSMNFLEGHLPLLAGCLSNHVERLDLAFAGESPFKGPLMTTPGFLALMSPMVKTLSLGNLKAFIRPPEFATICELTNLEELSISGSGEDEEEGLQQLTADISKLVNLRVLTLKTNDAVEDIPDAISCLQKLEHLRIETSWISEVPAGLATLGSLASLRITGNGPAGPQFPPSLQGLRSLSTVSLADCNLTRVPGEFSGLSALTSLDLCGNMFEAFEGRQWWPTELVRLTQLAELVMCDCRIVSLPAHVSALVQLTKLDISMNRLGSLPVELSSVRSLKELLANGNDLPTVPVPILRGLTALNTIDLSYQFEPYEGNPYFEVSSPLVPILHPSLAKIDLRQRTNWDTISLFHLGSAMGELASRRPVPTLLL